MKTTRTTTEDIAIWRQIYLQFEDEFGRLFLKDDNKKKKAHVDNSGEQTSNVLIHEPQLKWSLVLFFDAMVQIATNNSFTSKQQSCVDRRQFNHHNYLRKCIDDALGHVTAVNTTSSKTIAKIITPELQDERCLVLPALTASSSISSTSTSSMKSTKRVTPELEERCVIAPPAPRTTQGSVPISTKVPTTKASTQALTSSFFSSMMNVERNKPLSSMIPTTVTSTTSAAELSVSDDSFDDDEEEETDESSSQYLQPPKKVRKKNEKKNRKTTYCAWLDNWGSFEQLSDNFELYSGGGKSATRHAALARVLIHKLSMVSTMNIHVIVLDGPRRATWQEVFDYVLCHPGQIAPVSIRNARKSLAEARRIQQLYLGHQHLEMEGWDSDDEDNGISLGITQGPGFDKILPVPPTVFPGSGVNSAKYFPSSCSIPYHNVFDDSFSGVPGPTSKFTTSFMTNTLGDAPFDSMALFRTVPSMMMGHPKTIHTNGMIPICENMMDHHPVRSASIPMSISENDGQSGIGSVSTVYHVIPSSLPPTSTFCSSSVVPVCVHEMNHVPVPSAGGNTQLLMSHGIPDHNSNEDETCPLMELIESLDPLNLPIPDTTTSMGGLDALFVDHDQENGDVINVVDDKNIMSEFDLTHHSCCIPGRLFSFPPSHPPHT